MILKNLTYNTLLDSMNIPADSEHVLSPDALFMEDEADAGPVAYQELVLYSGQLVTFLWNMAARTAQQGWGMKPMEYLTSLGFAEREAAKLCWNANIRTDGIGRAIWGDCYNHFLSPHDTPILMDTNLLSSIHVASELAHST